MRFPHIRLVEQSEQKFENFVAFETVLKENKKEKKTRGTVIIGLFINKSVD